MATGGTTLLEMVNIWHLGTIVSCFIPKEPPQPLQWWAALEMCASGSSRASPGEHTLLRWAHLREHQSTPTATQTGGASFGNGREEFRPAGEWVLITGHATATLTAFLRKVTALMSVLRNYLPWAFPSCYSFSSSLLQSPHLGLSQLIFWNWLISVSYFSEKFIPIWGCWRIRSCSIKLWMGYQTFSSKPSKNYFWGLHSVCFLKHILYSCALKCLP